MKADDSLGPVHDFLGELRHTCEFWMAEFFDSVKRAGKTAFLPSLKEDHEVWNECVSEYGLGRPGFKDRVSHRLRTWFEKQERAQLLELLERKVREAWSTCFVENLEKLATSLAPETERVAAIKEAIDTSNSFGRKAS